MWTDEAELMCRSISEADLENMAEFSVRKEGGFLANYLAYRTSDGKICSPALYDEKTSRARTYLVIAKKTNEIIAYFTLKAGMIGIKQKRFSISQNIDSTPGIEIANFAINDEFKKKYGNLKGLGYIIFNDYILPKIEDARRIVGVRILYIYALPNNNLIEHYHSYGFTKLQAFQQKHIEKWFQPYYDKGCVFMYQNL